MFPFQMSNSYAGQYYIPMQTFDMCSGTLSGSLNLQMNACWDDLVARQHLYDVPYQTFDTFMPYGNTTSMHDYLLDPRLAIEQTKWANNGFGGFGGFGNFNNTGGFNMNFGGTNGMNGFGFGNTGDLWSPNNTSSAENSSGSSNSSKEDITANRQYKTLLSLVQELMNYSGLTSTEKDTLNAAIKASKKSKDENGDKMTPEKKLEILQNAYKSISKETRTSFIMESDKIGSDKKDKESTITARLIDSGYEFDNTFVDENISTLHESISKLTAKNGNLETDPILGALQAKQNNISNVDKGQTDILDVISSWNTTYKGSSGSDKRLITYIAEYYNDSSLDDEVRQTAKEKVLNPVVNSLISKAKSVKMSLDASSAKAIDNAIAEVSKALDNSTSRVDSNLSSAFDKLYLLTRLGAMSQLRNQLIDQYGDIDPDVFNNQMFAAEVLEDLKGEGFSESTIKGSNISAKTKAGATQSSSNETTTETPREQSQSLVESGILEKGSNNVKINNITYEGYIETKPTGGREYKRVFVLTKDGLKEAENVRYKDGQYSTVGTASIAGNVTSKDTIESDYNSADADKETLDKLKEKESDGKTVMKKLREWTTGDDDKIIASKLSDINQDNVYYFLKGVYSDRLNKDSCGCEGLLEKLDDDTSSSTVTMEMKRQLVQAILDKASQMGLTDDENYKTLKSDFAEFTGTGAFVTENDFNKTKDGGFWATLVGAHTNYNESMDQCIFKLFKLMYQKEQANL